MGKDIIRFSVEISEQANQALIAEAQKNRRSRIAQASLDLELLYNSEEVARIEAAAKQDHAEPAAA